MIQITRLPEPTILIQRKDNWKQVYLAKREENPKQRPQSSQYAHREIRETLEAMSFHKCFYCERKLTETKGEVDHYIEVAEKPELAFEWKNLYLSCSGCNKRKIENNRIPVSDCLNPCDSTIDPVDHLTFEDDIIRPKIGSELAAKTIQKYQLDRQDLNYRRLKQLQQFHKILIHIQKKQNVDGRNNLTDAEKETLLLFQAPDHAFSLMFQVSLSQVGIL